ncbi:RDD family protein [Streptomyces sp. NPDC049954]|uniref:RDD family protein n=1 Tax=Streptomyces sp. NPDC049954 TaxID=3155779 RepID=UPI0034202225
MSGLVTGEAVALELRAAKLPSRAVAVFIDLFVTWVVFLVLAVVLVMSTSSLDGAAQAALSVALVVLVLIGGPIAVETLSRGRSLGKLVFGLRVVRDDGGPIRFRHALVRGAVGAIEITGTSGLIAFVSSLVSERGRRVGDVLAGTLVVRERVPGGRVGAVPAAHPQWAGVFAGLDLSAVPESLWLAVRQYLTRMHQLDPEIGEAMAVRLASELLSLTGATVPPGAPAVQFLMALVRERQARDARRAFGDRHFAPPEDAGPARPDEGGAVPAPPFAPVAPAVPLAEPQVGERAGESTRRTGFVPPA